MMLCGAVKASQLLILIHMIMDVCRTRYDPKIHNSKHLVQMKDTISLQLFTSQKRNLKTSTLEFSYVTTQLLLDY